MIQTETDFLSAMKKVFPEVEKDSPQFKSSRLLFYMGAFNMITSKEMGKTKEELLGSVNELRDALKLAVHFGKKGIPPEDTLADYAEKDA